MPSEDLKLKNLDRLPPRVRVIAEPYARSLTDTYGADLVSIILYGSGTGDDFIPGRSNVNLIVILKSVSLSHLKKALKLVRRGRKSRITAPLVLSRDHILQSADTFPMEFIDIKENHVLLYGEDLFSDMDISHSNLRLQCEERLKGNLIRLRGAYLEVGLRRRGIESLLCDSLATLLPFLRRLVRLKSKEPPAGKEALLKAVAEEFTVDGGLLVDILKDKRGDERIGGKAAEQALERYMELLASLATSVDRM